MPFNVASIKDKAINAKNATVTKVQDTRDRHSSTPMARTRFADGGYMPDARKAPPPPPPPLRSFNSGSHSSRVSGDEERTKSPPPPVLRSTKPTAISSPAPAPVVSPSPPPPPGRVSSVMQRAKAFASQSQLTPPSAPAPAPAPTAPPPIRRPIQRTQIPDINIDSIDWANLSAVDKQAFFAWLDEFFARFVDRKRGVVHSTIRMKMEGADKVEEYVEPLPAPPVSDASVVTNVNASRGAPPMVKSWSKPAIDTINSQADFTPSYPPPTVHGSQALDIAYYFHPSTEWDSTWYTSPGNVPPPMESDRNRLHKAMMRSMGDTRNLYFAALFSDLSAVWAEVAYSASSARVEERSACFLHAPETLSREELVAASEMYGETIAAFAESYLGSGQFCARGECWDLAAEALKYFTEYPDFPQPVPSLGRTHGHLIFVGRAAGGQQVGRWRGDDDRVRRGDIVEWRSVRIGIVGMPPGSYAILGDPEHTAVISRDSVPSSNTYVQDGASIEPRELISLEVVEQSRNNVPPEPVRREYDMKMFEEGEVWIYRPVSMETYLGFGELKCEAPPGALSI